MSGPEPLRPSAPDEERHIPADEPLWNESWYFDFADPGLGLGGWVRLGLYPNEGHAWINALLCGPDMPTIALNDFAAAVPDDLSAVHGDGVELAQQLLEPLHSYRVSFAGTGQVYDDPATLLAGASGRPVIVSADLIWSTSGVPYQYRMTTRYEIPCTVSGSVTVDGTTHRIAAAAGQRDHSWGVRDWWGMDWVWTALHLDDGTHLHGAEVRLAGLGPMSVGYRQRADEPLVELSSVTAQEVFADNRLPLSTELVLEPGGLRVSTEVVAHAPVRLVADDGRVSEFPRSWVSVSTSDGRHGIGWMEWNRNLT